jgi:OOP family OmpA-OmpF porin
MEAIMKRSLVLIAATAVITLCASLAGAANKAETFSISPVIGGYTFDGVQDLDTRLLLGLRAGYNFTKAVGVEWAFDYATKDFHSNDRMLNGRLEALYHLFPDNRLVPYLAVGYGATHLKTPMQNQQNSGAFDYGLGVKYFLTDDVALRGDIRQFIIDRGPTLYNYEYTVGLYFPLEGAKPGPKPVAPPASELSVPPPPASVTEPLPPSKPVTPQPAAVIDSDKDGVPDTVDKCPGTPQGVKVDADGCPLDSDRDGVPDYLDRCPDTPEGVMVDKVGCPYPTDKPCQSITLDIEFDFDKSDIKPKYDNELKKVTDLMNRFSKTTAVIEGHTDNKGSAAYNIKLSERRADSVRKYIIKNGGIADNRISTKGYGLTKPVASNKTAEGRQKNRRIEAVIYCDSK